MWTEDGDEQADVCEGGEDQKGRLHGDGGGLYLKVTIEGTKSWVYRFMLDGKARWMGLGPYPLFSLAEARTKALDARKLKYEGTDPIEARRSHRAAQRVDAAKAISSKECAEAYIAAHKAGWKHPSILRNVNRRWRPMSIRSSVLCGSTSSTPAW